MTSWTIPYQTHRYHQQQRFAGCGLYTLKNVIESLQNEIDLTIKNYAPTFWNKISGFMLPKTVIKVLKKHGLNTTRGRYIIKGKDNKINFLKNLLHNGPVVLVIGHAYKGKKDFNLLKAVSVQHYVSLRGYDDQEGIFYVYDSGAPKRLIRKDLPVGNIALKYKDLIKYWKFGGFMVKKYFYISINYNL
ncbi:MAG: C39 family peptidase [Candidatus Absconditicoccaceae bacterium]